MGLDMYLRAEVYVAGYNHSKPEEQAMYRKVTRAVGLVKAAASDTPSLTVSVTACYWRKANAIHKWFVEHVQDGKDDCGHYSVSREELVTLRDLCREVLRVADIADGQPVHAGTTYRSGQPPEQHFVEGRAVLNQAVIHALLPTQDGFFFGATDYDEWYLRSVEHTATELDRVLAHTPATAWFEYHSSW